MTNHLQLVDVLSKIPAEDVAEIVKFASKLRGGGEDQPKKRGRKAKPKTKAKTKTKTKTKAKAKRKYTRRKQLDLDYSASAPVTIVDASPTNEASEEDYNYDA